MQVGVVRQRPLPAGVVHRPAVALAREIDPFGVAELVAHEVEIAFAGQAEGDQADQLVQGDAAVDDQVVAGLVHVPVHVLVHQPEGERLVADQRLVVALGVADVLFAVAAVEQRVKQLAEVPLLVASFP